MDTSRYILSEQQMKMLSAQAQEEIRAVLNRPAPIEIPPFPVEEVEATWTGAGTPPGRSPIAELRRPAPREVNWASSLHTPERKIRSETPSAPKKRELAPAANLSHFERMDTSFNERYFAAETEEEKEEVIEATMKHSERVAKDILARIEPAE